MLPVPKFILYLTKGSKKLKIHCFFIKDWIKLFTSTQLFCSLNNTKKRLYVDVPEMLSFNPKMRSRKYPISRNRYYIFSNNGNVSVFYC